MTNSNNINHIYYNCSSDDNDNNKCYNLKTMILTLFGTTITYFVVLFI